MKFAYTAEDVHRRREESGEGMMSCKLALERGELLLAIEGIRNGNHDWRIVADILEWLVKKAR